MTLIWTFVRNVENRVGDVKGKVQVQYHEADSTNAPTRGGLLRRSEEAG
jgi:hypothetical protein